MNKQSFINTILSDNDNIYPVSFQNLFYDPKTKTLTIYIYDDVDHLFELSVTDANKHAIVNSLLKPHNIDTILQLLNTSTGGSKKSRSKRRRGRKLRRRTRKH
jgi:hypothetical protein